jgi:hypothetical protein
MSRRASCSTTARFGDELTPYLLLSSTSIARASRVNSSTTFKNFSSRPS